jgi:DNA mismatch endonuclease (patch repair protein)
MSIPYPTPTTPAVSAAMRGNTARETKPEIRVRSALHRQGFRFRKNLRIATQRRAVNADIVFVTHRVAIFIDGCYWHGCPAHGRIPATNRGYWEQKIGRNVKRDAETTQLLSEIGWKACRYWEHEDPDEVAAHVASILQRRVVGGLTKSRDQS